MGEKLGECDEEKLLGGGLGIVYTLFVDVIPIRSKSEIQARWFVLP